MYKITVDDTLENEKNMLIEAIGCEIELTDEFLSRYCSKDIQDILLPVEYGKRGFILSCVEDISAWFNGSPASQSDGIWLNVSEIEVQFEDISQIEDPDEWYINGDLAYLNVGYGLSIDYNLDELRAAVLEYGSV